MKKNDYAKERLIICNKCPLNNNGICSQRLFLNPLTNDVSIKAKAGYISGCGCVIKFKVKHEYEHCPAKKW